MNDPLDTLDALAVQAQRRVDRLEQLMAVAKDERAMVFARAHEHGRSTGDLARMLPLSIHPNQVQHVVRVGRGLLSVQRRRERTTS